MSKITVATLVLLEMKSCTEIIFSNFLPVSYINSNSPGKFSVESTTYDWNGNPIVFPNCGAVRSIELMRFLLY